MSSELRSPTEDFESTNVQHCCLVFICPIEMREQNVKVIMKVKWNDAGANSSEP
jgi:hypothetical protein